MIINIPASLNILWQDFELHIEKDIVLKTGITYHLTGNNGSGKTSFIKKILIPLLNVNPQHQYILYVEQQIQNQFYALKAYSSLSKTSKHLSTFNEMVMYQLNDLKNMLLKDDRPVMLILDEFDITDEVKQTVYELEKNEICILYISHKPCLFDKKDNMVNLSFIRTTPTQSKVSVQ